MAKGSNAYKNVAMQAVGITGGQIVGNLIGKIGPLATNKLIGGAVQSIGGFIVAVKLGKKNALIESAGVGMAAQGVKTIIGNFIPSLVAGIGGSPGASLAGASYLVDTVKVSGPFSNANSLAGVGGGTDHWNDSSNGMM